MTSISAASAQTYQSPLQKLQDELLSEVKSGAIKSSDQDALSAALSDIDSAMQASRASGTRPSPDGLKSKIDDLIAGEVSSGKLTSDQATELQGIFKAAFANGPGGAGGPPPGGPPPTDGASASDDSSSSTTSIEDILKQFLESLQESLSASSSTTYGATGSTSAGGNGSFSALLIDYQS
jgi:flagellar hook-basal body complex protein FliE